MSKGNPLLSVRIPVDLDQLITQLCTTTGQKRSDVAIAALTQYLLPPNPDDELSQLRQRLNHVELLVQGLQARRKE
ncbi:hypothetical protein C7271_21380 [filamentous cyanobacterium CCP5]|nr:hypothetical protein C7293_30095 [filamentous cyanobacterium CCT1]PSN14852.1 hypothetical protein C7271_21380 [filamentous cyanobacterium CCP5]